MEETERRIEGRREERIISSEDMEGGIFLDEEEKNGSKGYKEGSSNERNHGNQFDHLKKCVKDFSFILLLIISIMTLFPKCVIGTSVTNNRYYKSPVPTFNQNDLVPCDDVLGTFGKNRPSSGSGAYGNQNSFGLPTDAFSSLAPSTGTEHGHAITYHPVTSTTERSIGLFTVGASVTATGRESRSLPFTHGRGKRQVKSLFPDTIKQRPFSFEVTGSEGNESMEKEVRIRKRRSGSDPRSISSCLCSRDRDGNGTAVICDHISFFGDFPPLPFRSHIHTFSQSSSGIQSLEPQLFTASIIPLKRIDFSHNLLRRLMERIFDGIESTLLELDLSYNLLGDQLNPIFSTNEFNRLNKLLSLHLSFNHIRALDNGIFKGLKHLQDLNLAGNDLSAIPTLTLSHLDSLISLDLSSNDFSEVKARSLPLRSLKWLNLTNCKISILHESSFQMLGSLEELYLANNNIREVHARAFDGLSNLELLDLSNNFLEYIPMEAISGLRKINRINLADNNIITIEEKSFNLNFDNLESLDLSRNRLTALSGGEIFLGLKNLKALNLAFNQLKKLDELDDSLFSPLSSLEILDLTDNALLNFPTRALLGLVNLRKLYLDYNLITSLSADNLETIPQVDELSLAFNLINELPDGVFASLSNLRLLNLHGNKLSVCDSKVFDGVSENLLGLDIGFNDLLEIPKLSMPKLMILNMASNNFAFIPPDGDIFKSLPGLRHFNLSCNAISHLPKGLFLHNKQLEVIDLSGNLFEKIESGIFDKINFTQIFLKGNKISSLSASAFQDLRRVKVIDLSHNDISTIKNGAFDTVPHLKTLNLSNNKLTAFKGDFFTSRTRVEELELSNNLITYLYPNSFIIHKRLKSVDLARNKLTYFPTEIVSGVKTLTRINLAGNKISSLENGNDFSNFSKLRALDLSFNALNFLPGNAFINSSNLNFINLANNQLTALSETAFKGITRLELDLSNNRLSALPGDIFSRGNVFQLISLDLSNNSFGAFPTSALRKQYSSLETLNMSKNKLGKLPSNSDILVNIKNLDLSFNPLSGETLISFLSEPKSVRRLNLANVALSQLVPTLEMPFLTSFNLSMNHLVKIHSESFDKITLLQILDLSGNKLNNLNTNINGLWRKVKELRELYVDHNPIQYIMKDDLNPLDKIRILHLSHLPFLSHFECESLNHLDRLEILNIFHYPSLPSLHLQDCFSYLSSKSLTEFRIEFKEPFLHSNLERILSSTRLHHLMITGTNLHSVAPSFLVGIKSPEISVSIKNTNISALPNALLAPLPVSTKVTLDIGDNLITSFSGAFIESIDNKQNSLKIIGANRNPIACDCKLESFWKYINLRLKLIPNAKYFNPMEDLFNVTCASPSELKGLKISEIDLPSLACTKDGSNKLASDHKIYGAPSTRQTKEPTPVIIVAPKKTTPMPVTTSRMKNGHRDANPKDNDLIYDANYNIPVNAIPASSNRDANSASNSLSNQRKNLMNRNNQLKTASSDLDANLVNGPSSKGSRDGATRRGNKVNLTKVDTMIIGIIAGVVSFICILVLILCCVRLRKSLSSSSSSNLISARDYLPPGIKPSCTCSNSASSNSGYFNCTNCITVSNLAPNCGATSNSNLNSANINYSPFSNSGLNYSNRNPAHAQRSAASIYGHIGGGGTNTISRSARSNYQQSLKVASYASNPYQQSSFLDRLSQSGAHSSHFRRENSANINKGAGYYIYESDENFR